MEQINGVTYQYQLLRYRHDHITGEFANIGMVYYDPATGFLRGEFEDKKYSRLSRFFGEAVQGSFILATLKQLKRALNTICEEGPEQLLNKYKRIEDITTRILTPDDNGLYFSDRWNGWHFDHAISFEELYDRIINQYQDEGIQRQDDSYAWKKVYKTYFDRYDLTTKLQKHTVKTATDTFNFEHTLKNGAWHCFESLSFALKQEGSIKDKIYRWDGIARELLTSQEPIKIYLLSLLPENSDLVDLIDKKLNIHDRNVEVRVVREEEADKIARALKQLMDEDKH